MVGFEIHAHRDGFAAEIDGVDLARPLSDELFDAVYDALIAYKVLVFRDQRLDDAAHLAFARRFGPLEDHVNRSTRHGNQPKLQVFQNVDQAGKPTGTHPERGTLVWHTDKSYIACPSLLTILRSPAVARAGGDTLFADMQRAYQALPGDLAERIGRLRAVHDWQRSRIKSGERPATAEEVREAPAVDHPLVRTHPVSGAKTLYIGNHASHIIGLEVAEGEALLADLERHATRPEFLHCHKWRDLDVLMWDNRCTMHRVTPYDAATEIRIVHRAVVRGDRPV